MARVGLRNLKTRCIGSVCTRKVFSHLYSSKASVLVQSAMPVVSETGPHVEVTIVSHSVDLTRGAGGYTPHLSADTRHAGREGVIISLSTDKGSITLVV